MVISIHIVYLLIIDSGLLLGLPPDLPMISNDVVISCHLTRVLSGVSPAWKPLKHRKKRRNLHLHPGGHRRGVEGAE